MSRLSAGAVLLALSSAAAHAQPQTPQWSVAFDDGQGAYSPTAADGVRAGGPAFACGEHGFITRVWYGDAALVSADDLSVVARFDIDGVDDDGWDGGGDLHWTLLADGTVYGTARRPGDPGPAQGARLSRFAAPGSPAADLIFVDLE